MKYVREFEGLRGAMAMWVVLGHWATTALIPHWIGSTKLYNGYAVDVFVILSGFAITALLDKRQEPYGLYLTRRILRIFPVYLIFLAFSVAIAPFALHVWQTIPTGYKMQGRIGIASDTLQYFWPHLLAHLFGIHGLIPPRALPSTDYAFLGQAWSISLEWQFYIIAPVMIKIIRKSNNYTSIPIIIFILSMNILSNYMPNGFIGNSFHNFYIGIVSFYVLKARFSSKTALMQIPVISTWLGIVIISIYFGSIGALPYLIWSSIMVIVIRSREDPNCRISKIISTTLNSTIFQWIGRMSYSIYLSHMLVIMLSLVIINSFGLEKSATSPLLL